jgi:hypothetical protein
VTGILVFGRVRRVLLRASIFAPLLAGVLCAFLILATSQAAAKFRGVSVKVVNETGTSLDVAEAIAKPYVSHRWALVEKTEKNLAKAGQVELETAFGSGVFVAIGQSRVKKRGLVFDNPPIGWPDAVEVAPGTDNKFWLRLDRVTPSPFNEGQSVSYDIPGTNLISTITRHRDSADFKEITVKVQPERTP